MAEYRKEGTYEKPIVTMNGIAMLLGLLALIVVEVFAIVAIRNPVVILAIALAIVFVALGFFMLQPNQAAVITLFGAYLGTERSPGLRWTLPWNARRRVSVRARNHSVETLKVNDKRGNPVEIAAVVVWRVDNTAQAVFDVEDYGSYVEVQSESAIRSIASRYAYDHGEEHELTLRGGADEITHALKEELQVRLSKAGVVVEEARLTHLAYAPEIAPAMLRRQQAEAIVAARQIIVHNAVSMVHMALHELDAKNLVRLDDERKAAMVSNLLVVLCGTTEASPVINTGTLYS